MKFRHYLIVTVVLAACTKPVDKLPVLGNREPVTKTVNGKTVTDTIYQTIPSFSFLNQDSVAVTEKDFDNTVYVADFFFTRCPSICPVMHRNMLKVYKEFKGQTDVRFLSHTIDAVYDQPSILKAYATKLGVDGNQWEFVNGTHDDVYRIAEKNYLVSVAKNDSAPGGYVHQGWFILVDKQKRLRGAYDGTQPAQVDQLIKDIKTLRQEYTNN